VAFVPTVALIVYQRLAADRDWPVTDAVVLVTTVGLVATALLALVRYQDDRAVARLLRDRDALLAAPARATGTLTYAGSTPVEDASAPVAAAGPALRGTLAVTTGSGSASARPLRVVVPAGVEGPRPGDPVAVWHAVGDEDASGALLVRYHRAWADDLVTALRSHGEEPSDPADARVAEQDTERDADDGPGTKNPADRSPGAE
jgi:hypothetical protein